MGSAASELRRAMQDVRDAEGFDEDDAEEVDEDDSLIEQLRDLYRSNAAIATAAGAPTADQAEREWRAKHPKAKPGSATAKKVRVDARKRRQTFLRNLQRYDNGTRRPRGTTGRLEALRDEKLRERLDIGASLAGLARVFQREGVTVSRLGRVTITVSTDTRERDRISKVTFGGIAHVGIPDDFAEAISAGDWTHAADVFFDCWGRAYGIGYVTIDEIDPFELEIGNDPDAYGYSSAA